MKLRILDNSIRLRLTRGEVEQVCNDGLVRGRVGFPANRYFDYVLESSPASVKTEAQLLQNVITVRVPQDDVHKWAKSAQVSIESEQMLEDGEQLRILIEKDFACLAPRAGEDESDMFPNPGAG